LLQAAAEEDRVDEGEGKGDGGAPEYGVRSATTVGAAAAEV